LPPRDEGNLAEYSLVTSATKAGLSSEPVI
jgi:hypothetical protein